jgi:hypothetical protein
MILLHMEFLNVFAVSRIYRDSLPMFQAYKPEWG